jgi:hypothetical protein
MKADTKRKQTGPSKPVAAAFLRKLASQVGLPIADKALRAAEFRALADCIVGKKRWRKPELANSFDVQAQINLAAEMVEGTSLSTDLHGNKLNVNTALDTWARRLVEQFGRTGPDDVEELRSQIAAARKRQRKAKPAK